MNCLLFGFPVPHVMRPSEHYPFPNTPYNFILLHLERLANQCYLQQEACPVWVAVRKNPSYLNCAENLSQCDMTSLPRRRSPGTTSY